MVFKFSKLEAGETLTEHVKQQMKTPERCIGPASATSFIYKSPLLMMPATRAASIDQAKGFISHAWREVSLYQKEWRAMVKSIASGIFTPLLSRGVLFGSEGQSQSRGLDYTFYPILLNEADGHYWGMLSDCSWTKGKLQMEFSLRDMISVKHSSTITSVVSLGGVMVWQNASSMELFGVHRQLISPQRSMDGEDLDHSQRFQFPRSHLWA